MSLLCQPCGLGNYYKLNIEFPIEDNPCMSYLIQRRKYHCMEGRSSVWLVWIQYLKYFIKISKPTLCEVQLTPTPLPTCVIVESDISSDWIQNLLLMISKSFFPIRVEFTFTRVHFVKLISMLRAKKCKDTWPKNILPNNILSKNIRLITFWQVFNWQTYYLMTFNNWYFAKHLPEATQPNLT